MDFDALNVNGADGTDGTDEFTGTATDAARRIDGRNFVLFAIGAFLLDQEDGPIRTMSRAVSAFVLAGSWQAEIVRPYGDACLDRRFFRPRDALDCPRWADL